MPGKRNLTIDEAFWSKVNKTEACWIWLGHRTKDRHGVPKYGILCYRGKHILAHRLSYEVHGKILEPGKELDHTCKNPACVNPDHLELVTHIVNVARGYWGTRTHCKRGHPKTGPGKCKECDALIKTEWVEENKDRVKQMQRQYYLDHREEYLERARRQRERKRQKHLSSQSPQA